MKGLGRCWLQVTCALVLAQAFASEGAQSRPTVDPVTGVWKLEKIVYPSSTVETQGGFIFLEGHYSTTVNFSLQGSQTNISQFGGYTVDGNHLILVPVVHVSTRAQTVIYEPEPPFTLEFTITGAEMRGVAVKDGTTFIFRRIR